MARSDYEMSGGGAYRIRDAYESGAPEVVSVHAKTARRTRFLRMQYFGDDYCAVFQDLKTGEVYAQSADE